MLNLQNGTLWVGEDKVGNFSLKARIAYDRAQEEDQKVILYFFVAMSRYFEKLLEGGKIQLLDNQKFPEQYQTNYKCFQFMFCRANHPKIITLIELKKWVSNHPRKRWLERMNRRDTHFAKLRIYDSSY